MGQPILIARCPRGPIKSIGFQSCENTCPERPLFPPKRFKPDRAKCPQGRGKAVRRIPISEVTFFGRGGAAHQEPPPLTAPRCHPR